MSVVAPNPADRLRESDLYAPVKTFLDSLGYDVKAEVKDCDVTATRDDELIIVELKTGFTIELLFQATRRQMIADGVYVAVPLPKGGYRARHYNDAVRLCRQLEIGLLWVGFTSTGVGHVDVAVHPTPARAPRRNTRKRLAVLTEHAARSGSLNVGGVTRRKILTAYKEKCLLVAALVREHGPAMPAQIKALGGPANSGAILSRNYHSWFERGSDGYQLTPAGRAALDEYADLIGDLTGRVVGAVALGDPVRRDGVVQAEVEAGASRIG